MLEALFLLISHRGDSSLNAVPISSHTVANIFDRYLYLVRFEDQTVAIGLSSSWFTAHGL
jgi:hypothetical protein